MARTTQEILDTMIARKDAEAALNGLTSSSQSAIWRLIMFICAATINIFEQLMDVQEAEIDTAARNAIGATGSWIQNKVLNFQYSDDPNNPQIAQETEPGVINYPVIDESLRIITRSSVKQQANKEVLIKTAKGDDLIEPLEAAQLAALQDYGKLWAVAGLDYRFISLESDKAKITLTIYYNGQYVLDNVKTNVKAAIETYFKDISSINFDGILNLNALNDAIQAVPGVNDTDFQGLTVRLRADQFTPGDSNNIIVNRQQETFAGHVVPETNTGETLDDTLTFIAG